MPKQLDAFSTVENARDFILYYKYLSFDVEFEKAAEELLMKAEEELQYLLESDKVPEQIYSKLTERFGYDYE